MAKQKLNLKLLRKVRDRIAKIPESYDQSEWIEHSDESPCGTVACLAGETIICAAPSVTKGIADLRRSVRRYITSGYNDAGVIRKARTLLGINLSDADAMFAGGGEEWPEPYRGRFQRAVRPKTKAKIAVAYLDECLKRKAVTW